MNYKYFDYDSSMKLEGMMIRSFVRKLKDRLPTGVLYEGLKKQRWLMRREQNPIFRGLMLALYKTRRDVYFKGGGRNRYARNIRLYNELHTLLPFELTLRKTTMQIKDLILPVPKGYEKSIFAEEFTDVVLHYIVGLDNIDRFRVFQGEGSYENPAYVTVKKGDIVLDCGANMGLYSAVASREGGVVYAFEPSKFIIDKYLHITAEENPNINIVNMALSNKKGKAEFIIEEIDLGHSRLKNEEGKRTEQVIVTTIDDFVREQKLERVDFIKADIEGAERNMLRGATWVLKHFAPKLSICTYHFPNDPEVLEKIIKEANSNYIVHHEPKKLYAWCHEK